MNRRQTAFQNHDLVTPVIGSDGRLLHPLQMLKHRVWDLSSIVRQRSNQLLDNPSAIDQSGIQFFREGYIDLLGYTKNWDSFDRLGREDIIHRWICFYTMVIDKMMLFGSLSVPVWSWKMERRTKLSQYGVC